MSEILELNQEQIAHLETRVELARIALIQMIEDDREALVSPFSD